MQRSHLPEGQEDHHLDHRKLEQRVEWGQQLVGAQVEQQQGIQRHRVRDVVDDGNPQEPAASWYQLWATDICTDATWRGSNLGGVDFGD